MKRAYATTPTYADHGTVTIVFTGASTHTETVSFETGFVRGQRFRFEYHSDFALRSRALMSERFLIWSDFAHTYSEWTIKPGVIDDGPDLSLALGAAAGVSAGSSIAIPSLLLPDVVRDAAVALRAPMLDGIETVDGHPCWRIHGQVRGGDVVTLWIDRATSLIRRMATRHHFATFDTEMATVFAPTAGQPIAAGSLQPPDLTASPPVPRPPVRPHAWIGTMITTNTTQVAAVVPGGPAERAGLRAGDVIVAVGGQAVASRDDITAQVLRAGTGAPVTVTITRGTARLDVPVTPEAFHGIGNVAHAMLVGKPAPAFDLPVVAGAGTAKLASLAGSVVLVDFWATWCGPCGMVVPHLNELARKYPALHVIGISGDDPDDIRTYARDHHVAYTLAADADETVRAAYWGTAFPMLVVIDQHGIVRDVSVGAGDESALDTLVDGLLRPAAP